MNRVTPKRKRNAVIFDIDGTLADASHRVHFLQGVKKDWDGFFAGQSEDTVRENVVSILNMYFENGIEIILLTGRGEQFRQVTADWLNRNDIYYNSLIMRPLGDKTDDHILKIDEIKKIQMSFEVVGFFEDRKRICDAARAHGLDVFQVAEGDF
jgi:uncharacterized HAD superfamily protein